MDQIQKEIEFYKANRHDFIRLYGGKHLVIKNMQLAGIFNTGSQAKDEALRLYEHGTYIIEHPLPIKT